MTLPKGLAVYVPIALARPDELDETAIKLTQARAAIAAIMVQGLPFAGPHGPVTPRLHLEHYVHAVDVLRRRHGIDCVGVTFPAVDGDLDDARAYLAECRSKTRTLGQLDAEPHGDAHWTPALLAPWKKDDPSLLVTSTRAELPHLGRLDLELWLQLEQQTSTLTLNKALAIGEQATALERIVCVGGLFDGEDDPRTPDEIRRDLSTCALQTKRSGRFGEWSAKSLTPAKIEVLADFVASKPF